MASLKAAPGSSGGIDLNALINSGGSFSGSLGGASGVSFTPQAATNTQSTTTSGNTSSVGTKATSSKGVSSGSSTKTLDKKNLDERSMKILQDAIRQMATGGSPLLASIDKNRQTAIGNTQGIIAGADPEAAVARAGGRTAELSRQLQEQAIASLLGADEASGFGGNALAQLRATDAAIRTAEAQARVEEEARNAAVAQQLSGTQVLDQVLAGGSAVQDQLTELLNLAKGAVEQGTESQQTRTVTDELQNEVSSEQVTADQLESITGSSIDPLEWAKLATQISLAGAAEDSGPSATEKALALFPALGGNPGDLLASLTGTPGLYSNRGSAATSGARQSFNQLLAMLR